MMRREAYMQFDGARSIDGHHHTVGIRLHAVHALHAAALTASVVVVTLESATTRHVSDVTLIPSSQFKQFKLGL